VVLVAAGLGLAGPAAAWSPAGESGGETRLLDVMVDLRLGRVLESVLDEPDRDPMQRAVYRVRLARADLVASAGDAAERRALIDTLFLRSAELIDGFSDHPLAAGWRLDRAEDAWRWLWPQEAAGIQVMLGVPDEAAVARVTRAAELMPRDVAAAARGLDAAIEQLEFAAGWPDDPALIREHRRLVEEERDGRLPVLRAIADAVAELGSPSRDQGPSSADVDRIVAGLRSVGARFAAPASGPDTGAAARATIEQLAGFVLLAGDRFDDAARAFDAAAASARTGGDAFNGFVSQLAAGAARIRGASGDGDARTAIERMIAPVLATSSEQAPGFNELLAADVAFRAAAARSRQPGRGVSRPLFEAGLRGWTHLADTDRRWFTVVRDRFARALRTGDPMGSLPPVARLGWSDALRAAGQGAAAMEMLAGLATDERSSRPGDRAEAWRALGQAAAERGQVAGAARATLAAAIVEPDPGRSAVLTDAALRLAAAVEPLAERGAVRSLGVDRWPVGADPAGESDGLVAALAFAAERHPELPGLDRWRTIGAGRLVAAGRTAEATRLLARIPPGSAEAPAALATGLQLARTRLREALDDADAAPESIAAAANAVLERVREAEAAVIAGQDTGGRLAARLADGRGAVIAADALLAVGRPADALRRLGLGRGQGTRSGTEPADGETTPPHPAAIDARDPAIRDAAGDLAARAILARLPSRIGEGDPRAAPELADTVAEVAGRSRRAARTLVVELGRRVSLVETERGPESDGDGDGVRGFGSGAGPAAGTDAFIAPLADGLAAWLRAAEPDGAASDEDAAADRAVRALAFRDVGRAELAAGRVSTAAAWFEALGGLESADPAVLLGAAEARYRTAALARAAGSAVNETDLVAAMGAYRRLAGDRATAGERRWWTAQLRMVQILDLTDRRTETIAPRIERLRLTDPSLGGPGFEAAFTALAARHAP
jgi:hypothetical protein